MVSQEFTAKESFRKYSNILYCTSMFLINFYYANSIIEMILFIFQCTKKEDIKICLKKLKLFTTLNKQIATKNQAIYLLFLQSKIFENIYLHEAKEKNENTTISNRNIL